MATKILQFITLYWEAIISCCALILSLTAVYISWKSLKIQRAHNHKSLKPMLHIEPCDYENSIEVVIKNEGLGPAYIESIQVKKNDYEIKPTIFDWLPKKLPENMNYTTYWTRHKDFVLRPGSNDFMIKIPIDINNEVEVFERENIRGILRNLVIELEYLDVYENKFPTYIKNLDLFSRVDHEN